jgi:hypothetical protein
MPLPSIFLSIRPAGSVTSSSHRVSEADERDGVAAPPDHTKCAAAWHLAPKQARDVCGGANQVAESAVRPMAQHVGHRRFVDKSAETAGLDAHLRIRRK